MITKWSWPDLRYYTSIFLERLSDRNVKIVGDLGKVLTGKLPNINQKLHWLKEFFRQAFIFTGISYKPQSRLTSSNEICHVSHFWKEKFCSILTPCKVYITLDRTCKRDRFLRCWIWSYCLLKCDAVETGKKVLTFWRSLVPPPSEDRNRDERDYPYIRTPTLLPWKLKQQVSPKRQYLSNTLHDITSRKIIV